MDFYNREQEIAQLSSIYDQSHVHAQMTVITGRRRIGKTSARMGNMFDAVIGEHQ